MIVCIAEKPSVGRDIARILGATTRHNGYLEGNGYCVTWVFGHLCELKDPADYTPLWKPWTVSRLPMIPPRFGIKLKNDTGVKAQFDTIKRLVEQCDMVINCGDAGQEGELIQRWVLQLTECKKPVKRLWISSMTDDAIREGFANLRENSDLESLYTAGLCRAIGDWILGINATRLYSLKYGTNRQILSVGRVQTPTLALVVKRQMEIDTFEPKDYWELKTLYREATFTAGIDAFETEEKANAAMAEVAQFPLEILDTQVKKGKEAPPKLFDLTALQVECNKKYGYSADETLKCIQSLYEKKLTTYPRVDTTYLTDDIYPKCPSILKALTPYAHLVSAIIDKKLPKSKKVFDNAKVTDHHAIIPTGQSIPAGLTEHEKYVFHTIALRFISIFYPDCVFEQTVVKARAGKTPFRATGRVIIDKGWKVVYESKAKQTTAKETSEGSEDSALLPPFVPGESGPHKPFLAKKTTQPPKYYTEGTLLKAMETAGSQVEDEELRESLKANGLGRPSTRAGIIETLYHRGYIVQERKSLRATQAGIDLIAIIKEELLKSAKLTGMWERKLREIERGTYSAKEFIDELKQMITEITSAVLTDPENRRITAVQMTADEISKKGTEEKKKGKGAKAVKTNKSSKTTKKKVTE